MTCSRLAALTLALAAFASGCGQKPEPTPPTPPVAVAKPTPPKDDEVSVERAKLDPADRALVEAQEWCVISTDERLGSMGAPIKLDIQGQPVFICCKGCKRKAESDPAKTLAKVAELKAKSAAQSGKN